MLQLIKAPPSKAKLSDHSVTHPTPSIQTKNREQLESYATDEPRASQSWACRGEACQLTVVKDAQCLEINNTARSPAAPQQTAAASTMLTLSLARAIAWKRGGDEYTRPWHRVLIPATALTGARKKTTRIRALYTELWLFAISLPTTTLCTMPRGKYQTETSLTHFLIENRVT